MNIKNTSTSGPPPVETCVVISRCRVPWQIWVVVALLILEGIGNLNDLQRNSSALGWIAFKCLFILGLIKGWRWVFVLFLIIGGLHVVVFSMVNAGGAIANLILILLVISAFRYYFPKHAPQQSNKQELGG